MLCALQLAEDVKGTTAPEGPKTLDEMRDVSHEAKPAPEVLGGSVSWLQRVVGLWNDISSIYVLNSNIYNCMAQLIHMDALCSGGKIYNNIKTLTSTVRWCQILNASWNH